jgi:uncharacterized protein
VAEGQDRADGRHAGLSVVTGSARIELVDALRAFALFGILQVNIQSFLWGAGDPLGAFIAPPRTIDAAVYLLVTALVATKFIALFAFLFGVGFALQMRRLARAAGDRVAARATYRRRLAFLLMLGLVHGTLLYYGDILTAYAVCGFVLLLYAHARAARLVRATRLWWVAYLALSVAWLAVGEASRRALPYEGDPTLVPEAMIERFEAYTQAGYLAQLPWRLQDYAWTTGLSLLTAAPFIVGLFLLGVLAGRLGWLTHPQRHARLWRNARRVGWASLPLAVLGAWLNFVAQRDSPADVPLLGYALVMASFGLMALYVATIVAHRDTPAMRAAVHWLAPAGRMPLTNYLLQSVLMGLMLSGWGLGWGVSLRHAELAGLALAIVGVQLVASRAWIARFGQGPVEAVWRRATYGRSAP